MVASVPLFVCAVLFCTVELARGAKALDRLANRRAQGYDHIEASASGTRALTLDQNVDKMTDGKPVIPNETINKLPGTPWKDPEQIAWDTMHAQQKDPFNYKQTGLGSSESLTLSKSSRSPRTSLCEFSALIDAAVADGTIPCIPPTDRGPFHGYPVRNNTPQMDPDECQLHQDQDQSELW